jgi:hypothetical protein
MAKRMDDNTSITAIPRGEPRSDFGLEAKDVMGCLKNGAPKGGIDKTVSGHGLPETTKAGQTGLETSQISQC